MIYADNAATTKISEAALNDYIKVDKKIGNTTNIVLLDSKDCSTMNVIQ